MPIPIISDTQFNCILVLQSLRTGDLPTGLTLFQDTLKPLCDRAGQICEFREFRSRSELADILWEIEANCRRAGWLPILHIEAHGDDIDGLACYPSKEEVSWHDLISVTRAINRACANRLVVVIAACYGIDAIRELANRGTLHEVAPFWLLMGPEDSISAPILEEAMVHFYSRVLTGSAVTEAIAERSPPLIAVLCESIFFNGMLNCLHTQHTGEGLELRIKKLAASTIASARMEGKICDTPALLRDIRMRLQLERFDLERFKRQFLMSDDPRNEGRFGIGLEQLLNELRSSPPHRFDGDRETKR